MNSVVCHERYGSQSVKKRYINSENSWIVLEDSKKWTSFSQAIRCVFLPQGYPESVSEDYMQYQIWDTVQAFASSITGTLAAHAMLRGVGVGDDTATVLAATITWLMKSGTGMVGQIIFTWKQGIFLDCDCKRWRLFADILNDFAIFLEILAPAADQYFRYVVCLAGVCKSIVGVTGGSTRAALTQHQARRNNMADVSAKDSSQETLVNLAALLCSLVLMPLVAQHQILIWMLFSMFTALHLFANYRAVKSVCIESFNQARLHAVVRQYLNTREQEAGKCVLGVREANVSEPVLSSVSRILNIELGCSLSKLVDSWADFQAVSRVYAGSEYMLTVNLKQGRTYIVLHADSRVEDQLQACFQAEVVEYCVCLASAGPSHHPLLESALTSAVDAARRQDEASLARHTRQFTEARFQEFITLCQQHGWSTNRVQLGAEEWRADWSSGQNSVDKKLYSTSQNITQRHSQVI